MDVLLAVFYALSFSIFWSGMWNIIYLPLAIGYELRRRQPPAFADRQPLVSIVIPAYNEARVIGACVESILAVPYPRKQIILVDDGSTDGTLALMRGYRGHPEVTVVAKANGGKASALNEGMRHARGDVVMFVDADGMFTERTIPEMLAGFEDERVGAVCGSDTPVNLDRPQTHLATIQSHVGTGFVRRALSLVNCLPIVSGNIGAFRRSVLAQTGPFREGMLGEDLELTWRVHRAGYSVRFQPAALVYAEVPGTLRGLWKQRVRWARGFLQTARLHWDMFARPRYGLFGLYLPVSFFNTVVVPLIQLAVLAVLPLVLIFGGVTLGGAAGLIGWLGIGWTFAIATFALVLDRAWHHARYLYAVPLWALYSFFISLVMLRAVVLELRGAEQRWNKLERVGISVAGVQRGPGPLDTLARRLRERLAYEMDLLRSYRPSIVALARRVEQRIRRPPARLTLLAGRAGLAILVASAVFGGGFLAGSASNGDQGGAIIARPIPAPPLAPVRAVSLDLADLAGSPQRHAELDMRMREAGVTMVGLSAGRVDWTTFRRAGYEENWASVVPRAAGDPFGAAVARYDTWAHVSAVVDAFAPRYLDVYPDEAAIDVDGLPSKYQASPVALVDGRFGDELILMLAYIAEHYPVDSITLTELFYDRSGFGAADLRSYREHSGSADWPRTAAGEIDVEHPSLGAWRSALVSRFVERAARVAHRHGKQLFVDVRVGWGDLSSEGRQSGHDYQLLLAHADRLVIWNYFGLRAYPPEYTRAIVDSLERYGPDRVIISYGLWASGGETLDADALRRGLETGVRSPIPHAWVTPSSLLDETHWEAMRAVWNE